MDFEKAFAEIKSKNQEECLSDERKEELVKMVEEMYYGTSDGDSSNDDNKYKISGIFNKYHNFQKKVVAVFACCLILTTCVFAGDFGDFISKIFSNQDTNIAFTVEKGYVQNVDTDYVENEGVKIKPNYYYLDDYYMYFAFDILAEDSFDEINLKKFEIRDENNEFIFSNFEFDNIKIFYQIQIKRMSNTNAIAIIKVSNLQENFLKYNNLKFTINEIEIGKSNNLKNILDNWNFEIGINSNISNENIEYYVDSQKLVDNYQVELRNNNLKVKIEFKENYIENLIINRDNIYIEDENGNIYNTSETIRKKTNLIESIFSIDNENFDNLKLKIKCSDEDILTFYLKQAGD